MLRAKLVAQGRVVLEGDPVLKESLVWTGGRVPPAAKAHRAKLVPVVRVVWTAFPGPQELGARLERPVRLGWMVMTGRSEPLDTRAAATWELQAQPGQRARPVLLVRTV